MNPSAKKQPKRRTKRDQAEAIHDLLLGLKTANKTLKTAGVVLLLARRTDLLYDLDLRRVQEELEDLLKEYTP